MSMVKGIDYAWQKPSPTFLRVNGFKFAMRYLSWLPNGKVLSASELKSLHANGLAVGFNWEFSANDMNGGFNAGVRQATEAVRQARALGLPRGCVIIYSADTEYLSKTTAGHARIREYLRGVRQVHNGVYAVGLYSGYGAIKYAFDNHLIDVGWQTYAWSGGRWDPRAQIQQYRNGVNVGGADADLDRGDIARAKLFAPPGSKPPVSVPQPPIKEEKMYKLGRLKGKHAVYIGDQITRRWVATTAQKNAFVKVYGEVKEYPTLQAMNDALGVLVGINKDDV